MNSLMDPVTLDILGRVSRRSDRCSEVSSDYQDKATPKGALPTTPTADSLDQITILGDDETDRSSTATGVPLTDPRWAGLVVHGIAIGFVSTTLPLTVYPFLTAYLNMEGTQTLSARALLMFPWVFRPLLRVLMDCAPAIRNNQFRPFLVLGWAIACLALGAIYFIDIPSPYFADLTVVGALSQLTEEEIASLNQSAPAHGAMYIMCMVVATLGYVIADVAADALIDQVAAEHFPPSEPGEDSPFVSAVTTRRFVAMLLALLFMGIGMNGAQYNGEFTFTLSYNEAMLVVAVVCSVPMFFALLMVEEASPERSALPDALRTVWRIFQHRAINVVIACRFAGGVMSGTSATPVDPITLYWIGVEPFYDNTWNFSVIIGVVVAVTLAEKKGLAINHLRLIVMANVVILVVDCVLTLLTIWDVVRSQWLWIGLPVIEALPSALEYIILNVILGEIAEPGTETITRELVTAVAFVAMSLGAGITKVIDAPFTISNDDILRDTDSVRADTTTVFLFAYIGQLASLMWLWVLPRNAHEARAWKHKHSSPAKKTGAWLVGVLVVSLLWSIAVHVLSVMSSTTCLRIAGGDGC